jgi:hypothetical protein
MGSERQTGKPRTRKLMVFLGSPLDDEGGQYFRKKAGRKLTTTLSNRLRGTKSGAGVHIEQGKRTRHTRNGSVLEEYHKGKTRTRGGALRGGLDDVPDTAARFSAVTRSVTSTRDKYSSHRKKTWWLPGRGS